MYDSAKQVSFWQDGTKWKITTDRWERNRGCGKTRRVSHKRIFGKEGWAGVLLWAVMAVCISAGLAGHGWNRYSFAEGGFWRADAASVTAAEGKQIVAEPEGDFSPIMEKSLPPQKVEVGIPLIVIDAGHGGEDNGCAREGVDEKDINLAIAKLVQKKLNGMGYQVIMTREDDRYLAVEERVRIANESGADLYISIHQNAYEDESAKGIEVWYNREKGGKENERLALLMQQQTVKQTNAVERELQEDSQMYGVVYTTMPACLIETGFLSNKEEREKLVTAEYQEQLAEGIVQAIEYYYHPKTMYLTFDDGPFRENTSQVLDVLKERNIKATFFVIGEYVEKNPEVAKRIVEEGHSIGIHCYNHDYKRLYASVDSFIEDFEKAHQIVLEVTGVDAKIFRFPGGSINGYNGEVKDGIIQEMTNRGYIYYDWNASLEDAVNDPKPEQLIQNAVESTFGRKKVIMLAHDVVYTTGICLNDLLDRFPEYRMEVLTEEVEPIQF